MKSLQPVRGTHDLLPDAFRRHRHVAGRAKAIAESYGYQEMATPILEFTEVFKRTLGDTSDVVSKEMYSFTDRGGEEVTLRPENTAGVCRAVMSNGLRQSLPVKFFYDAPMFRYERPQKGRQRQFHQIGVELIGVEGPLGDVEVIALGAHILDGLGILAKTTLELNTLGDQESRATYRAVLVDYFSARRAELSEDSRTRLERNPLRILDSKDDGDRRLVADAPSFQEYLTPAAQEFFATVRAGLETIGVAYKVNPRLVRGLDYYCHSAFEFTTTELGAQGTVLAGGRYDGLIEMMGGPATPGVGWAAGIERLAMMVADVPQPPRPIAVVPVGAAAELEALKLTQGLRRAGHAADIGYSGNLGRRLKRADRIGARVAVILGDDELARGAAMVRDLDTGDQSEVSLAALPDHLARFR